MCEYADTGTSLAVCRALRRVGRRRSGRGPQWQCPAIPRNSVWLLRRPRPRHGGCACRSPDSLGRGRESGIQYEAPGPRPLFECRVGGHGMIGTGALREGQEQLGPAGFA